MGTFVIVRDMADFDYHTVIAGGGPAGLQCGRILADLGYQVLVLEKSAVPGEPNYSTAGMPASDFRLLHLPDSIIGDDFNKFSLVTDHETATWNFEQTVGYVLNFRELKKFLASEIINHGGTVNYDSNVQGAEIGKDGLIKSISVDSGGTERKVTAQYFIDASGLQGILAVKAGLRRPQMGHPSVGIEKIIHTSQPLENFFSHSINVYVAHRFIPHGYAWVFCFGESTYKVGMAIYDRSPQAHDQLALDEHLDQFISNLGISGFQEIESHGGSIFVTGGQSKNVSGNLIAIGDTMSTINPLLGEGI